MQASQYKGLVVPVNLLALIPTDFATKRYEDARWKQRAFLFVEFVSCEGIATAETANNSKCIGAFVLWGICADADGWSSRASDHAAIVPGVRGQNHPGLDNLLLNLPSATFPSRGWRLFLFDTAVADHELE